MIHVDPAAIATSPAPAGAGPARALIERQLAMLSQLAEIGMEIAQAAGRAATAAASDGEADGGAVRGDPVLAYTRAARAVRLTIALQSKLLADLAALDKAQAAEDDADRSARRGRLRRLASRALEAEGLDGAALGRLSSKVWERLHDAEDDADLLGLPFAEAVAAICEELGLPPEWTARMVAAAGGTAEAGTAEAGAEPEADPPAFPTSRPEPPPDRGAATSPWRGAG